MKKLQRQVEGTTAILAATFGGMLFTAGVAGRDRTKLDARTAKELAIISRVLEKRLRDARAALTAATTALSEPVPAEAAASRKAIT